MNHDFVKIQERVNEVETLMKSSNNECGFTTEILLWNDGTSLVTCRRGLPDGNGKIIIHTFSSDVNGEINEEKNYLMSNSIKKGPKGERFYVISPEEHQENILSKIQNEQK